MIVQSNFTTWIRSGSDAKSGNRMQSINPQSGKEYIPRTRYLSLRDMSPGRLFRKLFQLGEWADAADKYLDSLALIGKINMMR